MDEVQGKDQADAGRKREPRCAWTGRSGTKLGGAELKKLEVAGGAMTKHATVTVWVLPEHERDLLEFLAFQKRNLGVFWALVIVSLLTLVFGRVAGGPEVLFGGSLVVLGLTFIALPFSNGTSGFPTAWRFPFGLRQNIVLTRSIGVLLLASGVAALVTGFP